MLVTWSVDLKCFIIKLLETTSVSCLKSVLKLIIHFGLDCASINRNWMNLRDADNGKILWQSNDDMYVQYLCVIFHIFVHYIIPVRNVQIVIYFLICYYRSVINFINS